MWLNTSQVIQILFINVNLKYQKIGCTDQKWQFTAYFFTFCYVMYSCISYIVLSSSNFWVSAFPGVEFYSRQCPSSYFCEISVYYNIYIIYIQLKHHFLPQIVHRISRNDKVKTFAWKFCKVFLFFIKNKDKNMTCT